MILSNGMNPIPISSGPASGNALKLTSSITESLQINNCPGVASATLDGRVGTPAATTVEVAGVMLTLTLMIEFEGSRSATSSWSCTASAQDRKNGAVRFFTRVVRVAELS